MTPDQLTRPYLHLLQTQGLHNEAYKWDLLRAQRGRPNLDAPDLAAELSDLDFANLVYQLARPQLIEFAAAEPERMREALRQLFAAEGAKLSRAIKQYRATCTEVLELSRPGEKLSNYQDERTAATLLFFHDPTQYTLYKNSVYKKFCALLDVESKPAGQKYAHYLELLKGFIVEHVAPNAELLATYRELVPDADELDPNYLLLAQDMLWRVLETGTDESAATYKTQYWFVGASIDDADQTQRFIADGIWRTGYTLDQLPALDNIEVGDPIAIKSTFIRRKGLPFDNRGEPVSTMSIKAIGEVTGRIDAQTFAVDWDPDFEPKAWHFYTYQGTLWHVAPGDWRTEALIDFAFQGAPQDYARFLTDPYWASRYGTATGPGDSGKPHPLNQILYGPPGTGKTYRTRSIAVEICDGSDAPDPDDRVAVRRRYRELVEEGRVAFVTFHPSMSYEDFVEGIKPETLEGSISYEIKPGIFKEIANDAQEERDVETILEEENFDDAYDRFVKTIKQGDNDIQFILRGGKELSVTHISEDGSITLSSADGVHPQPTYRTRVQRLHEQLPDLSSVKNITKSVRALSVGGYATAFYAVLKAFRTFLKRERTSSNKITKTEQPPHVLIIDEINRGNTPAIFGELITLLEADKRLGAAEEITVTLPYSKEPFGVPANLYLIGTMNTADRSVEALDAALRRRFEFTEVAPEPQVLAKAGLLPDGLLELADGTTLSLPNFLSTLNARITALRDRDHAIGHAPFLRVDSPRALQRGLAKAVIPLLREYFFGDDAQLARTLGLGFVRPVTASVGFAATGEDDLDLPTRYEIADPLADDFDLPEALRKGGFTPASPIP